MAQHEADGDHQQVHRELGHDERIGQISGCGEYLESRLDAVRHERPEDDRRHRAAGDTEGQHGDERAADDRIVRAFGGGDPLKAPLAIAGRVLVPPLGLVVGDDRSDLASRAGKHPDPRPEHGGPDEDRLAMGGKIPEHLAEGSLVRVVLRDEALVRTDEVQYLRE